VWLQFIALMLIRQRLPLMGTTGGGQHSALGAAVMALPSGLLAMVCEAMLKLESKLDVRPSFFGLCAAWPLARGEGAKSSTILPHGGGAPKAGGRRQYVPQPLSPIATTSMGKAWQLHGQSTGSLFWRR
jgi:hypothetical protein